MAVLEDREMPVTTKGRKKKKGAKDRFVEQLISRLMRLSKEKVDSFAELRTLFLQSQDNDEREEILKVAVEIIQPELIGMAWPKGVVADFESGLDPEAIRKVGAYRKQVGHRIKERRRALGMTQEDVAERAGIPQSHVCRLEKGLHAATNATIERVAKVLKVRPGDLDPACDS
jgi:DNA-binding XRE family transcriptional regulator